LLAGKRPDHVNTGQPILAVCPGTPNCVNSHAEGGYHAIEAFPVVTTQVDAMQSLRDIISSTPRCTLITSNDDYLYAECRSRLLGYVDDLEFAYDENANVIHVRSASRLGRSDFGVNRKRVERIRSLYAMK